MVQISTDAEALKPIIENSSDSQLSSADRLDQQTAIALDEVDKLATTAATNAAGGLDGAFARGATEIAPNKIARTETGQTKQIERLMQDTTTRVDRVLKRSADSYITTLPTAGTGNLERLLWANRADQVKNKITAVSASANESALVAEGFDAFYGEARNRAEQELSDQMAKFSDFQEKYNDSAWTRFRPTGAKRRQAARFEKFQAPMQEALQKRLDEMQSRIDGIKEGPQAQRVTNMSQKIDRRFKHAGADKKIKLWDQIQNATSYSGTITGLDLSEFGLANEDEKLLFIEALINGDLDWVKERLGLKQDSDTKFENQKAVIDSAIDQENIVSTNLNLEAYDFIKETTYLKGKEPHKETVSSADLAKLLESEFRTSNATKNQVDSWFSAAGLDTNNYDLLTDASKLVGFLIALKASGWDYVQHLNPETQAKLLKWLQQAEETRGGTVETFSAVEREKALNALDHLQGNIAGSTSGVNRDDSALGQIAQQINDINSFDIKSDNANTLKTAISTLFNTVEETYRDEFIDKCEGEIPQADFDLIKAAWQKARDAARTLKIKSNVWVKDREKWEKWNDQTNKSKNGSEAKKIQTEITALSGAGSKSIAQEKTRIDGKDYTSGPGTAADHKKAYDRDIAGLESMRDRLNRLQEKSDKLDEFDEPTLSDSEMLSSLYASITDQQLLSNDTKLSAEKDPQTQNLNTQIQNQLRTEFADQMEKTFLSKLADNDQYESLQKLGRGGRVKVHYKKIGATNNMRFPDQLDTPDIVEFKVNRVINGKIELVQDVAPAHGSRLVMVVTGSPFNASDSDLVARAGVSKQSILTTHPTATYGPSVNPEAAIITNMNVL